MIDLFKKNNKVEFFIFCFIFLSTTFISIVAGLMLFFCYLLLYKNSYSRISFIYICYVYAIISFTQYSTISTTDYDIIRYYSTYDIFAELNFDDAGKVILLNGDVFFYSVVYFLSKLFPSDPRILAFFFTFLTSVLLFLTIDNYVLKFSNKKRYNLSSLFFWIISFFLITSFPNLTNAYRQFFAMSLLLYGISRKELNKKYLIFLILAILSHWSMIVYLALYLLIGKFKGRLNYVLLVVPVISFFINIILPNLSFSERINSYLFGDEILGIDKTILVITMLVQTILLFIMNEYKAKLGVFYILGLACISYNLVFLVNSTIVIRHLFFVGFLVTIIFVFFLNVFPSFFYKNSKRIKFDLILLLLIFYNVKSLLLGGSIYLIFENQSYLQPFLLILRSPFPYEIIR